jgi:hypothetical protein
MILLEARDHGLDPEAGGLSPFDADSTAMYVHYMVRTQLYLDEAIHARLTKLARRQGRSLSELVRDAQARTYGRGGADERIETLRAIEGLWKDRADLGRTAEYVRRLRRDTRRSRRPSP